MGTWESEKIKWSDKTINNMHLKTKEDKLLKRFFLENAIKRYENFQNNFQWEKIEATELQNLKSDYHPPKKSILFASIKTL